MPELPDVEGQREILMSHGLKRRIEKVSLHDRRIVKEVSPQKLSSALKGKRLVSTRRHGKYLFGELERDGWLVLHFGMTGGLVAYRSDEPPPKQEKVTFDLEGGSHLAYICTRMLGQVGWTEDLDRYVDEKGLGPDALEGKIDARWLAEALAGRKGPIKPVLMDQSLLAGIGNVYTDEILFQAGLHPQSRSDRVGREAAGELFRTMRRVLKVAADKGGAVDRLPRGYLLPEREAGRPCPKCRGQIKQVKMGGRTSYFCPSCQRKL